jgi:hypothetical protein
VLSESELAVLAMEGGRWAEATEHVDRALTAVDEHRMYDYATHLDEPGRLTDPGTDALGRLGGDDDHEREERDERHSG